MRRTIHLLSGIGLIVFGYRLARHVEFETERPFDSVDKQALYESGFLSGKDFAMQWHKGNHPDCDRCPH